MSCSSGPKSIRTILNGSGTTIRSIPKGDDTTSTSLPSPQRERSSFKETISNSNYSESGSNSSIHEPSVSRANYDSKEFSTRNPKDFKRTLQPSLESKNFKSPSASPNRSRSPSISSICSCCSCSEFFDYERNIDFDTWANDPIPEFKSLKSSHSKRASLSKPKSKSAKFTDNESRTLPSLFTQNRSTATISKETLPADSATSKSAKSKKKKKKQGSKSTLKEEKLPLEGDSLWKSRSAAEERRLAHVFWLKLSEDERRKLVGLTDKDSEVFSNLQNLHESHFYSKMATFNPSNVSTKKQKKRSTANFPPRRLEHDFEFRYKPLDHREFNAKHSHDEDASNNDSSAKRDITLEKTSKQKEQETGSEIKSKILSVADELLKNGGHNFIETMETLEIERERLHKEYKEHHDHLMRLHQRQHRHHMRHYHHHHHSGDDNDDDDDCDSDGFGSYDPCLDAPLLTRVECECARNPDCDDSDCCCDEYIGSDGDLDDDDDDDDDDDNHGHHRHGDHEDEDDDLSETKSLDQNFYRKIDLDKPTEPYKPGFLTDSPFRPEKFCDNEECINHFGHPTNYSFDPKAMNCSSQDEHSSEKQSMLQMFVVKVFEHRILTAYREKVAFERQRSLLKELELEDKPKKAKERKKNPGKEKKRNKRKTQRPNQKTSHTLSSVKNISTVDENLDIREEEEQGEAEQGDIGDGRKEQLEGLYNRMEAKKGPLDEDSKMRRTLKVPIYPPSQEIGNLSMSNKEKKKKSKSKIMPKNMTNHEDNKSVTHSTSVDANPKASSQVKVSHEKKETPKINNHPTPKNQTLERNAQMHTNILGTASKFKPSPKLNSKEDSKAKKRPSAPKFPNATKEPIQNSSNRHENYTRTPPQTQATKMTRPEKFVETTNNTGNTLKKKPSTQLQDVTHSNNAPKHKPNPVKREGSNSSQITGTVPSIQFGELPVSIKNYDRNASNVVDRNGACSIYPTINIANPEVGTIEDQYIKPSIPYLPAYAVVTPQHKSSKCKKLPEMQFKHQDTKKEQGKHDEIKKIGHVPNGETEAAIVQPNESTLTTMISQCTLAENIPGVSKLMAPPGMLQPIISSTQLQSQTPSNVSNGSLFFSSSNSTQEYGKVPVLNGMYTAPHSLQNTPTNRAGLSNPSKLGLTEIKQIQNRAKEAYFSLLLSLGIRSTTLGADRPYFRFNQLHQRCLELSPGQPITPQELYEACTHITPPSLSQSILGFGSSSISSPNITPAFQFQRDTFTQELLISYSFASSILGDSLTHSQMGSISSQPPQEYIHPQQYQTQHPQYIHHSMGGHIYHNSPHHHPPTPIGLSSHLPYEYEYQQYLEANRDHNDSNNSHNNNNINTSMHHSRSASNIMSIPSYSSSTPTSVLSFSANINAHTPSHAGLNIERPQILFNQFGNHSSNKFQAYQQLPPLPTNGNSTDSLDFRSFSQLK